VVAFSTSGGGAQLNGLSVRPPSLLRATSDEDQSNLETQVPSSATRSFGRFLTTATVLFFIFVCSIVVNRIVKGLLAIATISLFSLFSSDSVDPIGRTIFFVESGIAAICSISFAYWAWRYYRKLQARSAA
jgi:hypothetical protein